MEKAELSNYRRIHNKIEPLHLWHVAKRAPIYIREITTLVNIICGNVPKALMYAVIDEDVHFKCRVCEKTFSDVPRHFILDCQCTIDSREHMMNKIQDILPVRCSASLFNQDDEELYIGLLSGKFPIMNDNDINTKDMFLITVSTGISKIILDVLSSEDNFRF